MLIDQMITTLSPGDAYSREDLYRSFLVEKHDLTDSSFRWLLYKLLLEKKLYKTGYDTYMIDKPVERYTYRPLYSANALSLIKTLDEGYSSLKFVVFESVLLNEFLNHQIAQNTLYVQVEKDISSFVFDELRKKFNKCVLYRPGKKEFERYWCPNCMVVTDLISQSPLSKDDQHEITIEKLLVDIVAEKSVSASFSPAELPSIYASALNTYKVDKNKMNRYAGRRGKGEEIRRLLGV